MRLKLSLLLLGMIIGVALCGVVYVLVGFSRGLGQWGGLRYETDGDVRATLQETGIALPNNAYGIHYAVSGFVDKSAWIRFSVPKHEIWSVVESSIKKSESDFSYDQPENLLREIHQDKGQSYDLKWWNPSSVTSPRSWSHREGRFFEDWLIDSKSGTFYITRWDY
ncbi:hypothetical protein N9Z02_01990 [Akkermansiaceae bacterium]|nr:hypothetical protein [Akkermansiaceae bacterium]